jgi:hypothetical protein
MSDEMASDTGDELRLLLAIFPDLADIRALAVSPDPDRKRRKDVKARSEGEVRGTERTGHRARPRIYLVAWS